MRVLEALAGGAAGAVALTLVHETARKTFENAPRMDVLGMRAIVRSYDKLNLTPPQDGNLHRQALVGDLVSNAAFYSLVGSGAGVWLRGTLLGLVAGVGAVVLPPYLGLGQQPVWKTRQTQIMTLSWYLLGGLTAAAASRLTGKVIGSADGNHRS